MNGDTIDSKPAHTGKNFQHAERLPADRGVADSD
jgi:hypothetical protein